MMPEAWTDLIDALELLSQGRTDEVSPFHCEHDRLYVMSDPTAFRPEELDVLEALGFHADVETGTFYSFRYGSA